MSLISIGKYSNIFHSIYFRQPLYHVIKLYQIVFMRKMMCVHVWYEHEGILDKVFCQGLLLCLWRIPSKNFMHSPDHILLKIMFMRYINLWRKPLRSLSAYANYCMIGMHLLRILFIWISIYKIRFSNNND